MTDSVQLIDTSRPENDTPIMFHSTPGKDIPGFLCGNARCRNPECDLVMPCACDPQNRIPVVQKDAEKGKTLVICGAGPSLNEAYRQIRKADHVWGCNSAANWLADKGWNLTHAFAIDSSARMFGEVWVDPPDAHYLIATTVNPLLTDHLLEHDREITFFHSRRGAPNEEILCAELFPPAPICENGLNCVNRAVELAVFLGYKRITLAGCDSAFAPGDQMYADGRGINNHDCIVEGQIDGTMWRTKPDMLLSAVCLAQMQWALGKRRLRFVGNTLPRALARKDLDFHDRCIQWVGPPEDRRRLRPPEGTPTP